MRIGLSRKKLFAVCAILLGYIVNLIVGGTEARRRSLQLSGESTSPDRVSVVVNVTGVSQVAQELTAQLTFRVAGKLALDAVTPATNLKLFVNNVGGEQEFDFERGSRMNPVEVVFPLNGDLNRYPFDRYRTTLSLLMVKPAARGGPPITEDSGTVESGQDRQAELPFGAEALKKTLPVPLSVALSAQIPGTKFSGSIDRTTTSEFKAIDLNLRRTNNVIIVSILISATMMGLAASLLFIVLFLIGARQESSLVPLSLSIALIFGLPALRNVQPGVPPIGAFCDFISFIWAELIVAVSGLMFAWTWLRAAKSGSS